MSAVAISVAIRLFGALIEFGLKYFGSKFVQEVLDRISLFYVTTQERSLKNTISQEIKALDLEARGQAVRAREFAEK